VPLTVSTETSAWKAQSDVEGTSTVNVPDVAFCEPSRLPCDHSRRYHVDVPGEGIVNVVVVAVITGGFGNAPDAGDESATTTPASAATRINGRGLRRPRECSVLVVMRPKVTTIFR
jgi:hypothetical protein